MLGDTTTGAFRPVAHLAPGAATIAVRVEAHTDNADALRGLQGKLRVERLGDAATTAWQDLALSDSADPRRRVAIAEVNLASVPAGAYIVTIVLEGPGGEIATRTRRFEK